MFFWWLNLVRLYSLCKILYPKRRIESYSILGTIVSPNKILLIWIEGLFLEAEASSKKDLGAPEFILVGRGVTSEGGSCCNDMRVVKDHITYDSGFYILVSS